MVKPKPDVPAGLRLRGKKYWSDITVRGRRIRKPLSTSQRVALSLLAELRVRAEKGRHGVVDNGHLWQPIRERYERHISKNAKASNYKAVLDAFKEFADVRTVEEIDLDLIERWRDWLPTREGKEGLAARTINKYVGVIRHALNQAVRWKLIWHNPIAGIPPLSERTKKKIRRALTVEELKLVLAECKPDSRAILTFIAMTGCRAGEAITLTWGNVSFDRKEATFPQPKRNGPRTVPLNATALDTLARLHGEAGDTGAKAIVFRKQSGLTWANNLSRSFHQACRRAGIEGGHKGGSVDVHSLRGTFVTLALEAGVDPKTIQDLVGHATMNMTMKHYAKTRDASRRRAVELVFFQGAETPAQSQIGHTPPGGKAAAPKKQGAKRNRR